MAALRRRLTKTSCCLAFSSIIFSASTIIAAATTSSGNIQNSPCEFNSSIFEPTIRFHQNGSAMETNGTYWEYEKDGISQRCACQSSRPCLRKCCPMDQVMNLTSEECVPYPAKRPWFKPIVKDDNGSNMRAVNGEEYFALFHAEGCKDGKTRLDPKNFPDHEFILRASDGHLSVPNLNESDVGPERFCLEYFPDINNYLPYLCSDNPNKTEEAHEQSQCLKIIYIIYPIGMFISIIFLIMSFLIYAFIKELKNLHGKCSLCHIASLLTAYIFLVLVQVLGDFLTDEICIASGFIIYYAFLSTFLWLNIMCIDMSIAFSGLKAMSGSIQERDRKKFLIYVLYAWGLPFVILCFSIYMEFGPVPDYLLKPQFKRYCWFESDRSKVAYFIGPVAAIITVNMCLFVFTAVKIFILKKETAMLKRGDSRRHENEDNRQRFNLYLKLFIVMGVNWALEIISWAVGGSECIWIPADLFNTLQGLFIFLIFVWKDKIRRKVIKRLCPQLFAKMKMFQSKECSSSDGRSTCTVNSTINDGDNIKLSSTKSINTGT